MMDQSAAWFVLTMAVIDILIGPFEVGKTIRMDWVRYLYIVIVRGCTILLAGYVLGWWTI